MKKRISLSTVILLLIAAMLLTAMSSCALADSYYRDENGGAVTNGQPAVSDKLGQIIDLFKTYSYYEIDEEVLCRAMVSGMGLAINDRYAEYYDAEEFALMTAENQGETQGNGVTVIENADYKCIEIISVLPNSPALAAGVEPGDLIVYVGGGENKESVSELGYYAALAKLQGVKGTVCEFTALRGDKEIEFSIMRDTFTSESVTYRVCATDPKVGIVKLIQFDLTTPGQFCTAMDSLIASGVFLVSYALYGWVLKANVYLSRTIQVQENQTVVTTGPYRVVRHPMYSATVLLFLSIPLILGSVYAFFIFLFSK